MSDRTTDIAARDGQLTTVALLFGVGPGGESLIITAKNRGDAMLRMLRQVGTAKVDHLAKTGEPAYKPTKDDDEDAQSRKAFTREKTIQMQMQTDLVQIRAGLNAAEVKHGIEMSQHEGWVGADGEYNTIEQAFANVDPTPEQQASSGRMREIHAFITKTARQLVEHGVPEEDVIALNRDGMKTNLANINAVANRVIESPLPEKRKKQDLRMIVELGKNAESATDFRRQVQAYLQPTDDVPGIILFTSRTAGSTTQVTCEMEQHLYRALFLPRLSGRLKAAPAGSLYVTLSPQLVTDTFKGTEIPWNPAQKKLMRIALHSNLPTSLCLSLLEALPDDEHSVSSMQTATNLGESQVLRAMGHLTHCTHDGITPFVTYKEDADGVRHWRLA